MSRARRTLLVVAATLVLLVVAARLALDPLVTWRTKKVLGSMDGIRGSFADVEVHVRDLSYVIRGLELEKVSAEGSALPFFAARYAGFGLYWKQLLRGHLVADVELVEPMLNLVEAGKKEEQEGEGQEPEQVPEIGRRLGELAPFRIDRLEIKGGALRWIDAREPERPLLRISRIEATLENFATRAALAKGEPTVLGVRALLQDSGNITVFATADPLAKTLTFAGQGELKGLKLTEVGEFIAAKSGIRPEKGELDLAVRFRAEDGRLTGGLRPIVKGAETKAAAEGLGAKLESALADLSLNIFSDDVPGRDAVATTIPIAGRVDAPQVQAVPTILGILRNAFVRGLSFGMQGLPPPKAEEREGVMRQARRAFKPEGGTKAQPNEGGEK
ncbi:MAG TPA: DUF748 domain-containing protein [Anaeromyxobacteraceae bacterium]|nr:DUF748 domain-containing protein [Anaeromyxobacteraceae bacterium]